MASSTLDLLFKIKADSSDASRDIKRLRTTFASEVKGIETAGVSSFGNLGNAAAGLSKALPLVAIGITAVAGAAAAAAVGLFTLAKNTADFGSKIFDASQKTGLATETISALKFAAEQSGSSLADFEVGIKIFARTIGDAARGSDEARDKLVRLGVDPQSGLTDLEGALAQAIKRINEADEGTQQLNAAMDAFGSRSGPNLIATVKTMNGDLIKFIATAKALGITFSEEDAKAADKFGDTLEVLSAQFKGIGFQIARQFMPEIQSAMESVSGFVRDNQETFRGWGRNISDLASGAIPVIKAAFAGLDTSLGTNTTNWKDLGAGMGFWVAQVANVLKGIALIGEDLAWLGARVSESIQGWTLLYNAMARAFSRGGAGPPQANYEGETDKPGDPGYEERNKYVLAGSAPATGALPSWMTGRPRYNVGQTSKGGGKGGADKEEQAALQRRAAYLQLAFAETERIFAGNVAAEQRLYELGLQNLEAYIAGLVKANEQKNKDLTDEFAIERENIERDVKTQADRDLKNLQVDAKVDAARVAFEAEKNRIADFQKQQEFEAERAQKQRLLALQDEFDNQLLERLQASADQGYIKEADVEKVRLDLLNRNFKARKEILEFELSNAGEFSDKYKEILDALILLETQRADAVERATQRIMEARALEATSLPSGPGTTPATMGDDPTFGLGAPPEIGLSWETLGNIIVDAMGRSVTAVQFAGFAFKTLFDGFRAGIAAAVQAAILYGGSIGQAFKKAVASAIAAISAEAAIQAIFNLAKGFAALAGFMPGPALLYFKAAALFGAVAIGSGLAGRAIAGNSFQTQSASTGANAGGSSGGGTGARGYEAPTTKIIEQDRNQASRDSHVFIHLEMDDHALAKAFVRDIRGNGAIRQLVALKSEV